jgi:N-acetylmuramoyl-L-alanine amidase
MATATDIQRRLHALGFYQGKIDGDIGPLTLSAISSALDKVATKPVPKSIDNPAKPLRRVHTLVIHCTATPEGREMTREDIKRGHLARGFRDIGYHKLVHLDGSVSEGRSEAVEGAHVSGHNTGTLGYSYIGGVDAQGRAKDTRTAAQKATLLRLAEEAVARYGLKAIKGHRDFSPDKDGDGMVEPHEFIKECPCYSAIPEYAALLA